MRILAICKEDPQWILGGMGRHVRELYRAMARIPGVEIDLLTSGPGEGCHPYLGFRKHQSDKLVCFKPLGPGMSSYLLDDLQLARTLMRLVAQGHRWDVVHGHEWGSVQLTRMARDALDLPSVNTLHLCITKLGMMADECPTDAPPENCAPPEPTVYLWQQEGNLVCDPDEFIVCSHAYERIVRDTFMVQRPINVIPNGIDCEQWNPSVGDAARAIAKHRLPDRPICLFVGRVADMKGIRPLLHAVETMDPGFCVVVAGEVNANTPEEREAWDVTKKLRILETEYPNRLRWVGFQEHDQDLHDLYRVAAVGLMPSIHEPFGIVALEMMAHGVPLISTEVDGLGEIVVDAEGEEYALIIEPNSADQILSALDRVRSPDVRAELSRLGLKRAREFDWDRVAEDTLAVYNQAVGGYQNGKRDRQVAPPVGERLGQTGLRLDRGAQVGGQPGAG